MGIGATIISLLSAGNTHQGLGGPGVIQVPYSNYLSLGKHAGENPVTPLTLHLKLLGTDIRSYKLTLTYLSAP
jgi:hypothetical protein